MRLKFAALVAVADVAELSPRRCFGMAMGHLTPRRVDHLECVSVPMMLIKVGRVQVLVSCFHLPSGPSAQKRPTTSLIGGLIPWAIWSSTSVWVKMTGSMGSSMHEALHMGATFQGLQLMRGELDL